MGLIDLIIDAKNEIIAGLVIALLAWAYHKFRVLMKLYKQKKQELERMKEEIKQLEATKEKHERLTAESQRKDDTLRQAEKKSQDASQRIEELRRQIEALQQEQEQKKANKKLPPMSDYEFVELCKSGDARRVEEAIMNGANVNAWDKYGYTALMRAVYNDKTETAALLIKYGADINAKRDDGKTALTYCRRGKIAELLRAHGAK